MNIGGTRVLVLTLVPPPFLWFVLLLTNVKMVWLNIYGHIWQKSEKSESPGWNRKPFLSIDRHRRFGSSGVRTPPMLLAMRWHLPSYADTNPNRPGPMIPTSLLRWYTLHFTFQLGALYLIGSVRNSSVHHGLLHTYKPIFSDFFKIGAILPIYIHNSLSFSALQCSIYRTEPGNTFAWITLTTHTCTNCTNFFKILQGSSHFSKTQHVLYFLNALGSMISNMTYAYILHNIEQTLHRSCTDLAHILHT